MPRLTYSPEGVEPTVWDFSFEQFLLPEAIAISKASGLDYNDFPLAFIKYDPAIVYATFQVLQRRAGKDGKALQPRAGELKPEVTETEAREWVDAILADAGRDPSLWPEELGDAIRLLASVAGVDFGDLIEVADDDSAEDDVVTLDDGEDYSEPAAAEPEAPKA